jgi:hypothetical protein
MGKIAQSIFGGDRSQSRQESGNKAFDSLSGQLNPQVGQGTEALGSLGALLGLGGDTQGQTAAFNNYRDSAGYNFIRDQGTEAIAGNQAAKGLLGSGGTLRAMSAFGQNTANTFLNDYLKNLLGVNQAGTQAAGVISDAGKFGTGSSSASKKPGIGGVLSQFASLGGGG